MARRLVCISCSDGAGGKEVGQLVAERLDLRYVDEDIIAAAARKARVDSGLMADIEQRKPLIRRLLDELAESGAAGLAVGGFPRPMPRRPRATSCVRSSATQSRRQRPKEGS